MRWQAYSRDMSMDPHCALLYNFQNDRGGNTITNMAASNADDPNFIPSSLNGQVLDYNNSFRPMAFNSNLRGLWVNDGRFRSKPCLSLPASGAFIAPGINGPETGQLAKVLRKTQLVTVTMWTNVQNWGQAGNSVLYWTVAYGGAAGNGERLLNIHLPWGGSIVWDAPYSVPGYANNRVSYNIAGRFSSGTFGALPRTCALG